MGWHYLLALQSLVRCLPFFFAPRPRTPLRVLCIGAFDYLARVQGRAIGPATHQALAIACDLGAIVNDHYDQRVFDRTEYRALRSALRSCVSDSYTRRYLQAVRWSERSCPPLADSERVLAYRSRVVEVSLLWLWSIVFGEDEDRTLFNCLLPLVELVQLVDDLLDWREDWRNGRPTYVTANFEEYLDRSPARPSLGRLQPFNVARPPNFQRDVIRRDNLQFIMDGFRRRLVRAGRSTAARPLVLAGAVPWLLASLLCRKRFR